MRRAPPRRLRLFSWEAWVVALAKRRAKKKNRWRDSVAVERKSTNNAGGLDQHATRAGRLDYVIIFQTYNRGFNTRSLPSTLSTSEEETGPGVVYKESPRSIAVTYRRTDL